MGPVLGDSGCFAPLMGQEGTSSLLCAEPWPEPLCWQQGFLLSWGWRWEGVPQCPALVPSGCLGCR